MRPFLAIALGVAALVAGLSSPVPAHDPIPGPSLAPIGDAPVAASSSSPLPNQPNQPRVLGHIYTSAYCTSFIEHFNAATTIVLANDRHLDTVDTTLQKIENDWNKRDGALRIYDDRVNLISTVGDMLKTIPKSQESVNKLLAQAKITNDPVRKAALNEAASQLQHTLDRQRSVAYDLTGVIHVLMDKHTRQDMAETNIQYTLQPGMPPVRITALDDVVPEPGTYTLMQPKPSASPSPSQLEYVMQWDRQRWIIGSAESKAAVAADRIVRICNDDHPIVPVPSPHPLPHPSP